MIFCGPDSREGWKTLDAMKRPHIDYVATVPPFPSEVTAQQWSEVEWIHGIACLVPWEAEEAVREIYAMLAPGGKLTIETPDFNRAKASVLWTFGDPALKYPAHMNRWSYTPESLTELLRAVGFSRMDVLPAQTHHPARDFRVEAYR
jgi:predicted SAM-dependent methyltransferase